MSAEPLSIGVEEEFHVVDAATRRPADEGLEDADVEPELHRDMVETTTGMCATLAEVRAELDRLRTSAVQAAAGTGRRIAAAGTLPMSEWRDAEVSPTPRYEVVALGTTPAADLLAAFLDLLRPALRAAGDAEEVSRLLDSALARGSGADRQRDAFDRRRRLTDVVDLICAETAGVAADRRP